MLEKLKIVKENKVVKTISDILYVILCVIVILMLIVVVFQRVTNNDIAIGGYRMFSVITESMLPKYEVGDILIAKEIELNDIKVGEDIVYKGKKGTFKDKIVTHQVISIEETEGEYTIVTKGLANEEKDPEIKGEQVYGRVVYKVHTLSFIGKLIQNLYVFYFLIFVPISIIIYRQIRNIMSHFSEDNTEG